MKNSFVFYLKVTVFTIFLARGYQHVFWDVPYRAILWYENMMKPFLSFFGIEWQSFVNNLEIDRQIQWIIKSIGWIYWLAAILVLRLNKSSRKSEKLVVKLISIWQFLVVFLMTKESFFQIGQFFEHSLQLGLPILLLLLTSQKIGKDKIIFYLKIVTGLTFFCHGLYALGFYPVPGNFIDMTIAILKVSENNARLFLWVVGIVDLIIFPLLFLKRVQQSVLLYASIWGFLTAFARIVAHFSYDFPLQTLHQYAFETVVRLCHGIAPFLIFLLNKDIKYASFKFSPEEK